MMKGNLLQTALCSRLMLIVIQYFGNLLIPDHDAGVFISPKTPETPNFMDNAIQQVLGGFVRWDGQYFLHIAKYGYTYENTLAFFPLYPLTVRFISNILNGQFFALDTNLLLIFVLFNTGIFILAVQTLYELTLLLFDEKIAYKTAVIFCYNPASVFFIAPYTESLFSYLTFKSILNCLIIFKKYYKMNIRWFYHPLYLLPISLSTGVRSNGILNLGFFIYVYICLLYKHFPKSNYTRLLYFIKHTISVLVNSIFCLIPFIFYQLYSYKMFCTNFETDLPENNIKYALEKDLILPGQFLYRNQSWCYKQIPLAYSYVQDHYWNVGFLKYYEFKQLPNFLLAMPILYVLLKNCLKHIQYNFTMKIKDIFNLDCLVNKGTKPLNDVFTPNMNVFVVHATFLTIFCIFFIHIQVSTRILCSATPLFYWYSVKHFTFNEDISFWSNFNLIKCYFVSYFVIGTVLYSNFLPWT